MVTEYRDASAILGTSSDTDLGVVADMAKGEYARNVTENLPRDYVQMYHPDGTTSLVQLPPLGRNGKNIGDRQKKIMHFILNKKREGKQWWYPSPPAGWQPQELKWRCPVQGCTRAGGLPDLLNLYRHIFQKHPGEKELYEGVIKAIKTKLAEAIPADLATLLNEDGDTAPVVSQSEIEAAKFEDAQAIFDTPAVPSVVFEGCPYCEEWQAKAEWSEKQVHNYRSMHIRGSHPDKIEVADATPESDGDD